PGASDNTKLAAVGQVIDLLGEGIGELESEAVRHAPVGGNLQRIICRISESAGKATDTARTARAVLREWSQHRGDRTRAGAEGLPDFGKRRLRQRDVGRRRLSVQQTSEGQVSRQHRIRPDAIVTAANQEVTDAG